MNHFSVMLLAQHVLDIHKDIKSAVRTLTAQPLNPVDARNHIIPAAHIFRFHRLNHRLIAVQRGNRRRLCDRVGVGGRVTLHIAHRLNHRRLGYGVADSPPGHGIGLCHTVYNDGMLFDLIAEGRDIDMLSLIDQLFVNLVKDDVDGMFYRKCADLLHFLFGINHTGRIAGGVEHQRSGLVGAGRR